MEVLNVARLTERAGRSAAEAEPKANTSDSAFASRIMARTPDDGRLAISARERAVSTMILRAGPKPAAGALPPLLERG